MKLTINYNQLVTFDSIGIFFMKSSTIYDQMYVGKYGFISNFCRYNLDIEENFFQHQGERL